MIEKVLIEFKKQMNRSKNILISPLGFEIGFAILADRTLNNTKLELSKLWTEESDSEIESIINRLKRNPIIEENSKFQSHIEIEYNKSLSPNSTIEIDEEYSKYLTIKYQESNSRNVGFIIKNTLEFEDKWYSKFRPLGKPNYFYSSSNDKIPMNFISQFLSNEKNQIKYFSGNKFSSIQVPLKSKNFVFEIYLPNEGYTLHELINDSSFFDFLGSGKNFFLPKYLEVVIPEFEGNFNIEFDRSNTWLNLTEIYNPSFDFSPLLNSTEVLFIKSVQQQNKLKLSEEGIKASSMTKIIGGIGGIPEYDKHIYFEADRPFIYSIKSVNTNVILFLGVFEEPEVFRQKLPESWSMLQSIQSKLIRRFKPFIYDISIRGRVYLGLLCLDKLVAVVKSNISWADSLINDLLKFIVGDNEILQEIKLLSFDSFEMTGYLSENKYFDLDRVKEIRTMYPSYSKILGNICDIANYGTRKLDEPFTVSACYRCTINILEEINIQKIELPNLNEFKLLNTEKSFIGEGLQIDKSRLNNLPLL